MSDSDVSFLIEENDRLRVIITELRTALKLANVAITDWLHTYAPEHCDEARVIEACKRIEVAGGTVGYISDAFLYIQGAIAKGDNT